MNEFGLAPTALDASMNAESLLELYELCADDLKRVQTFGNLVTPRLDEYLQAFYSWLETQPEFHQFFSDPDNLARVQRMQVDYWSDFFKAQVDDGYVARRHTLGEAHARIGLSLPVYFAAMNMSLTVFVDQLYDNSLSEAEYRATIRSVTKLMHLDTAIVVDTFSRMTAQTITEQSQVLIEMSTPVAEIWQDILMLPIVGIIDSQRSQDVMNAMLTKISETQSKIIILDISGVAVVDTAVANHLIKITKATKLMGCECVISGISPAIAQTIVELGIDVGDIRTTATLRDALEIGFDTTGVELKEIR